MTIYQSHITHLTNTYVLPHTVSASGRVADLYNGFGISSST